MNIMEEKIKHFIVDNFLFGDDDGITNDTSFLENEIIDSTGVLELVMFLDEEFSVEVADEELVPENLDSINSILNFLMTKKGGQEWLN